MKLWDSGYEAAECSTGECAITPKGLILCHSDLLALANRNIQALSEQLRSPAGRDAAARVVSLVAHEHERFARRESA